MPGGLERFVAAARAAGIDPAVRGFPEGTKTAQDAARAIGCDVAQIVTSLVFVADGRPVLALTSGRHQVDTALLGARCGSEVVRRATPGTVFPLPSTELVRLCGGTVAVFHGSPPQG